MCAICDMIDARTKLLEELVYRLGCVEAELRFGYPKRAVAAEDRSKLMLTRLLDNIKKTHSLIITDGVDKKDMH